MNLCVCCAYMSACVSVRLCIHVYAFLCLSLDVWHVFFLCARRHSICLSHALFEVKMWLPAAIKRRQQLENKAGGGAPGRLPCFRAGLYFSREVLFGAALMKGQVEMTWEREERERERDWGMKGKDGQTDGRRMPPTATSDRTGKLHLGDGLVKVCWLDLWGWTASVSSLLRWAKGTEHMRSEWQGRRNISGQERAWCDSVIELCGVYPYHSFKCKLSRWHDSF